MPSPRRRTAAAAAVRVQRTSMRKETRVKCENATLGHENVQFDDFRIISRQNRVSLACAKQRKADEFIHMAVSFEFTRDASQRNYLLHHRSIRNKTKVNDIYVLAIVTELALLQRLAYPDF